MIDIVIILYLNIHVLIVGTIRVWGTDDEMKQQRERERLKLKQRKQRKKEEVRMIVSTTCLLLHD